MKFLLTLLFLLMPFSLLAQGPIKVTNPVELADFAPPKEIEGLQWNRWTSENFTVLCIDDTQAKYLYSHLELVKSWIYSRWGFYDIGFSVECKLIAVKDPNLYSKLFHLNQSKVEVRKEGNKITELIIFVLADTTPSQTVPVPLSEICYAEFAQRFDTEFGMWAYRGMSVLNGSLIQIRGEIQDLKPYLINQKPIYFSQGMMEMTRGEYEKLSEENKYLFDQTSTAFCLLIRKEFGQDKFHRFLKESSNPKNALKVLGFDSYESMDRTFKRYLIDLTNDIEEEKTPDSYLQINAKE